MGILLNFNNYKKDMLDNMLSRFAVKNIKTGQPSYVLTAFILGIAVVNIKLLLSGVEFNGFKMSDFSGVDYAAAVAALGGIYTLNKQVKYSKDKKEE